jgi:hypothetical protein
MMDLLEDMGDTFTVGPNGSADFPQPTPIATEYGLIWAT